MTLLNPGDTFPDLDLNLVGGEREWRGCGR